MHQLKVFCVASWYISAATLAGWSASLPRVRSALEPSSPIGIPLLLLLTVRQVCTMLCFESMSMLTPSGCKLSKLPPQATVLPQAGYDSTPLCQKGKMVNRGAKTDVGSLQNLFSKG